MRGKAHLIIGGIAGVGVSLWSKGTIDPMVIAVAGVSSLAPDLDQPNSMLGRKLTFNPATVKLGLMFGGAGLAIYTWLMQNFKFMATGVLMGLALAVVGLIVNPNTTRKAILAMIGGAFIALGLIMTKQYWLILLGAFLIVAPLTGHRTYTHTLWALILWGVIGWGAEKAGLEGAFVGAVAGYFSHLFADSLTVAKVKWLYPIINKPFGIGLMKSDQNRFMEVLIISGIGFIVGVLSFNVI